LTDMDLSIKDAATALGRSPRQIRYMISTGKITAVKQNGFWIIKSEDLPLNDEQRERIRSRISDVRHALDEALEPVEKAATPPDKKAKSEGKEGKHYSVTDFQAFQAGERIYRDMVEALGKDDEACHHLFGALSSVTQGCHAFHPGDKCGKLTTAREAAALSVTCLLLHGKSGEKERRAFAVRIEQDLIPRIARLLAAHERRSRKSRFSSFGSSAGIDRESR